MATQVDEKEFTSYTPTAGQHSGGASEANDFSIEQPDYPDSSRSRKGLIQNRSMATLLFQSLAIAAIPYGEGAPFIDTIYGGGPLSIFVGWFVVLVLDECVAISLSDLSSAFPNSAGPSFWSFQIAKKHKGVYAFINGWMWLLGNWTITPSVNFGIASLIAATIGIYHDELHGK